MKNQIKYVLLIALSSLIFCCSPAFCSENTVYFCKNNLSPRIYIDTSYFIDNFNVSALKWQALFQKFSWEYSIGKWSLRTLLCHLIESRLPKNLTPVLILDIGSHKGEASSRLDIRGKSVKIIGIDIGAKKLYQNKDIFVMNANAEDIDSYAIPEQARKPFREFLPKKIPFEKNNSFFEILKGKIPLIIISDTLNYVDYKKVLTLCIPFLSNNGYLVVLNTVGIDDEKKTFSPLFSPKGVKRKGQISRFIDEFFKDLLKEIDAEKEMKSPGNSLNLAFGRLMWTPQTELLLFQKKQARNNSFLFSSLGKPPLMPDNNIDNSI